MAPAIRVTTWQSWQPSFRPKPEGPDYLERGLRAAFCVGDRIGRSRHAWRGSRLLPKTGEPASGRIGGEPCWKLTGAPDAGGWGLPRLPAALMGTRQQGRWKPRVACRMRSLLLVDWPLILAGLVPQRCIPWARGQKNAPPWGRAIRGKARLSQSGMDCFASGAGAGECSCCASGTPGTSFSLRWRVGSRWPQADAVDSCRFEASS